MLQAQNNSQYRIVRSNLGSGGSSKNIVTSQGQYHVSQSIGQASVIGTYQSNGYFLRQGYQQPSSKIQPSRNFNTELRAKVYPNPFNQAVIITFGNIITKDISVMLFDVKARLIYNKIFLPEQTIELKINDISNGTYFLKVSSGSLFFNTKLLKI